MGVNLLFEQKILVKQRNDINSYNYNTEHTTKWNTLSHGTM